jgi:hypothetical protein
MPTIEVTLPSLRRIVVSFRDGEAPYERSPREPRFSELLTLTECTPPILTVTDRGADVDLRTLSLADYHTLRAIGLASDWIEEDEVEVPCRNCGGRFLTRPCHNLPLGPYLRDELSDLELDATLPKDVPHLLPSAPGGGQGEARVDGSGEHAPSSDAACSHKATFRERTVTQALPLWRALRRRNWAFTPAVVEAAGLSTLGEAGTPADIARLLQTLGPASEDAVIELFLACHYPPRLSGIAVCSACGARNDVDAPFDREFVGALPLRHRDEEAAEESFPSFDVFSAEVSARAERILGDHLADVFVVVERGPAACDDGGEPLLGSFTPKPHGVHEIALYYRTFRAMWSEDGPYDVYEEVSETLAHELAHYLAYRTGHDEVDDEERDAIAEETERRFGKPKPLADGIPMLARDVAAFLRHTWPLWVFLVGMAIVALASMSHGP